MFGAGEEGKRLSAPPTCIFGFGTKILECVVTNMTIDETQFNSLFQAFLIKSFGLFFVPEQQEVEIRSRWKVG